ncbi:hypothetical protein SARC_05101 [Sphaeroforma arctica JP610]|uniref:WW domain-containing protein n=1 Tax=Sphaeroforma arctica JP610 TaxID=667725 RepID=A0A0L0G0J8_9EUKA|nr:hypothetical protein SARC_05101 [Sphaeroforma arctica JP610]KNC82627.1 hypothetical protein SARC_05101 [Sphaeroforma arctica JP610]|eukprot:XP_014156529.1 hypothetical protein SARC_05101 [Sphaeroforma arctica JP610]
MASDEEPSIYEWTALVDGNTGHYYYWNTFDGSVVWQLPVDAKGYNVYVQEENGTQVLASIALKTEGSTNLHDSVSITPDDSPPGVDAVGVGEATIGNKSISTSIHTSTLSSPVLRNDGVQTDTGAIAKSTKVGLGTTEQSSFTGAASVSKGPILKRDLKVVGDTDTTLTASNRLINVISPGKASGVDTANRTPKDDVKVAQTVQKGPGLKVGVTKAASTQSSDTSTASGSAHTLSSWPVLVRNAQLTRDIKEAASPALTPAGEHTSADTTEPVHTPKPHVTIDTDNMKDTLAAVSKAKPVDTVTSINNEGTSSSISDESKAVAKSGSLLGGLASVNYSSSSDGSDSEPESDSDTEKDRMDSMATGQWYKNTTLDTNTNTNTKIEGPTNSDFQPESEPTTEKEGEDVSEHEPFDADKKAGVDASDVGLGSMAEWKSCDGMPSSEANEQAAQDIAHMGSAVLEETQNKGEDGLGDQEKEAGGAVVGVDEGDGVVVVGDESANATQTVVSKACPDPSGDDESANVEKDGEMKVGIDTVDDSDLEEGHCKAVTMATATNIKPVTVECIDVDGDGMTNAATSAVVSTVCSTTQVLDDDSTIGVRDDETLSVEARVSGKRSASTVEQDDVILRGDTRETGKWTELSVAGTAMEAKAPSGVGVKAGFRVKRARINLQANPLEVEEDVQNSATSEQDGTGAAIVPDVVKPMSVTDKVAQFLAHITEIAQRSDERFEKERTTVTTTTDLATLLTNKFSALGYSIADPSAIPVMAVELRTRWLDWSAGEISTEYFISKIKEHAQTLKVHEQSDLPNSWKCVWNQERNAYEYENQVIGELSDMHPSYHQVTTVYKPAETHLPGDTHTHTQPPEPNEPVRAPPEPASPGSHSPPPPPPPPPSDDAHAPPLPPYAPDSVTVNAPTLYVSDANSHADPPVPWDSCTKV